MKPLILIAASSEKSRRTIVRALARLPHETAANADEVLRRLVEDSGPMVLVWEVEAGGEFDLRPFEAVRAVRPHLPVLILDPARPLTPATLKREVLRLSAKAVPETPRADLEVLRLVLGRLASSRAVFDQLPVAATVTDIHGRVLDANREAVKLAGRRPEVGSDQTCREYWRCLVPEAHCPLKRALATGKTVYHARVASCSQKGARTMIERISNIRLSGRAKRGLIVTGPATAYFRRMKRLRRDASLDPLTTVYNRRRFEDLTARAHRGERRGRISAFVMLDVDGLKTVNDRHGHAAGDRLLHRLGEVLARNTRRGDVVGRVGGDEFAIYCPDTTPERARTLVTRLVCAVEDSNAHEPREPRLSVSFGLACAAGRRIQDLRELADAELYRRKRGGRKPRGDEA